MSDTSRTRKRRFPECDVADASGSSKLLLERQQLDPPKEHLRALRLKQNLSLGVTCLRASIHDDTVEDVGDLVAGAEAFEGVPFAERLLDVLLAAETLDVLPLGIAAPPIGAAADEL